MGKRLIARTVGVLAAEVGLIMTMIAPAQAVQPYLVGLSDVDVTPLLSVGDRVPLLGDPAREYQMVGIPDGLGFVGVAKDNDDDDDDGDGERSAKSRSARRKPAGVLFMNHELTKSTVSEPVIGAPSNRGAFVSKYVMGSDGSVLGGARAYDTVWAENTLVGPAAQADNATPGFGRFCSGSLAGKEVGFDRPIFLTGEEADGVDSFDGRGGQSVAVFDGEAHTLPGFGHFAKENQVVMPRTGRKTFVMVLEDGPSGPDSQLYLYAGVKDGKRKDALGRNGLTDGSLYTFVPDDASKPNEAAFETGSMTGTWKRIDGAASMDATQLETASDALGAFGFVRIEDGAFGRQTGRDFFFVTTGGNAAAGDELGRIWHLRFDPKDPLARATLSVVVNADDVIAGGGDTALSPDNLDVSRHELMIQEDGTAQSRSVMGAKGRDGNIWRFPLVRGHRGQSVDVAGAERVAELNPPGRDGTAVGPGVWESSGIIDVSSVFGSDAWIADVQAHPPTTAPAPGTVEDGQLVLIEA